MLKYEKTAKDNRILVTFKDRTPLFTQDFAKALAIAVFLHGSFIFLFNIKDIGLLMSFRPANLVFNVESVLASNQVSLEEETAGRSREDAMQEPPYENLFLVQMPLIDIEKSFDESLHHLDGKILDEVEFLPPAKRKKKIEILLSHEMANKKIINESEIAKFEKIEEKGYAKFNVQVEDKTGKIIWSELKTSSGLKKLDQQARKLLAALEFEAAENSFATAGEVEIFFND